MYTGGEPQGAAEGMSTGVVFLWQYNISVMRHNPFINHTVLM